MIFTYLLGYGRSENIIKHPIHLFGQSELLRMIKPKATNLLCWPGGPTHPLTHPQKKPKQVLTYLLTYLEKFSKSKDLQKLLFSFVEDSSKMCEKEGR
jgi:hypothetical protein